MTQTEETKVAVMQEQINYIKTQVDAIANKLDNSYTTKEEHLFLEKRTLNIENNLNKLAWIVITAVLMAVLGSVIISIK